MVDAKEKNELPSSPGTYALVLSVSARRRIVVGKLGVLTVQPGFYVYVGSALGPGGLAARVGRHCRREKGLRWHVDYLRAVMRLEEVWYVTGNDQWECRWADALNTMPGASTPLAGFGASDCRCPSHLFFFTTRPSFSLFRQEAQSRAIQQFLLVQGK